MVTQGHSARASPRPGELPTWQPRQRRSRSTDVDRRHTTPASLGHRPVARMLGTLRRSAQCRACDEGVELTIGTAPRRAGGSGQEHTHPLRSDPGCASAWVVRERHRTTRACGTPARGGDDLLGGSRSGRVS